MIIMPEQFTLDEIKDDEIMQKLFRKKSGIRESTIEGYLHAFKNFCNFTGLTPTEIHDKHRDDLLNRVPIFQMWLNEAFDDYVAYRIDSNKSYGTINVDISKIKSFFNAFKLIPIPNPEISKKHVPEDFKYALKVEDIRKAIMNSPLTYQALFITQAQTGLSVGDALLLDVQDFIDAVSEKDEDLTLKEAIYRVKTDNNLIGCFDLRRKKSRIQFYTFAGHETLNRIAALLESKDEEFLKPESPIFMKNIDRLPKQDKEKHLQDLRLTQNVVGNYVDRMHTIKNIFPRIKVDGKEKNYFRTHKLRKWFANQVKNGANFDLTDTKYLMGQKIGDVAERYFDPNNYTALKNNYRKALPYLAITEEVVMEENLEALEKLQQEKDALEEILYRQQQEITQQKQDVKDISLKVEEMESQTAANILKIFEEGMQTRTELAPEDTPSSEITAKALQNLLESLQKQANKE